MVATSESEVFKIIKQQLIANKINPNCLREYYCADQKEFENLKADIKKRVKDKCRFLIKEIDGSIHVIAFINVDVKKLEKAAMPGFIDGASESLSGLITNSKSLSKIAFLDNNLSFDNLKFDQERKKVEKKVETTVENKAAPKIVKSASRLSIKGKNEFSGTEF
jgi:hypothetical protein